MRCFMLTTMFVLFAAAPVLATPESGHGHKGPTSYYGALKITNQCDAAVTISVNGYSYIWLEPGASTTFGFWMDKKSISVEVMANIFLAPGISDSTSKKVTVQADKTAEAIISCTTTETSVTLSITTGGTK